MEKPERRTKKMAKKRHLNTGKPAEQAEKKTPAVPANYSTSWRDEEELVDYEPESPPSFSLAVEELSDPEDRPRTPVPGQADSSSPEYDFGVNPAEDAAMAGRKRRQNFQEEEEQRRIAAKDDSAALPRKGGKSVVPAKRDGVANLPRTASGGRKSAIDKDYSAAPPRKGGKSVIPGKTGRQSGKPTNKHFGGK
jgi:hypothetical protein